MIQAWLERYRRAWASDDPEDIGALFADDAQYFTEPYAQPWVGRDEIIRRWIETGDSEISWSFEHRVLVDTGDLAVVWGHTIYPKDADAPRREYDNIWIVRLEPSGRATEFTEWYMRRPEE